MSKIDYQALREAAQNAKDLGGIKNYKRGEKAVAEFESLITPHIVLALLYELDKWKQESSAWQAVAEKQLALATDAEKRNAELESLIAPQLPQPAPSSVPEVVGWEDVPEEITEDDIALASAWAHGFNQCRAAMLQGAEPASNHEELPLDYLQGQKDGLEWAAQLAEANHPQTGDWLYDDPVELAKAIRKGPDMPEAAGNYPVTPDGWISCSERMPVIGELNWRTSFPLLVTCEIGVIPAYYGFVRVNGNKHYGFMESLKYGDDSRNHPQTNEYDLISNVTHWMPLPEPPQEVK
ncbi:DUF551 domain-containing protein [Escherichia coli]|uniref:DUF551 domain-containing protein n=1 Tax=Escherichia coli TaxID=562 RepID=UPI00351D01D5